jgi:hypothetical protein
LNQPSVHRIAPGIGNQLMIWLPVRATIPRSSEQVETSMTAGAGQSSVFFAAALDMALAIGALGLCALLILAGIAAMIDKRAKRSQSGLRANS